MVSTQYRSVQIATLSDDLQIQETEAIQYLVRAHQEVGQGCFCPPRVEWLKEKNWSFVVGSQWLVTSNLS